MTLEEATRKESFQQGVHQGIEQGIQQNRELIAANMIRAGVEFSFISTMTGISMAALRQIEQDLSV